MLFPGLPGWLRVFVATSCELGAQVEMRGIYWYSVRTVQRYSLGVTPRDKKLLKITASLPRRVQSTQG